jgi:hypothetical protein
VRERRAEVSGGHSSDERVDNITRGSEGPLAGCATKAWTAAGVPERVRTCSREGPGSWSARIAWTMRQRPGTAECVWPTARGNAR